jgi:hypothetical protein
MIEIGNLGIENKIEKKRKIGKCQEQSNQFHSLALTSSIRQLTTVKTLKNN